MSDYSPLKMADDHLFQPGREKTGGRKLGVRNKLSERFLRDLHSEWERSGEATLKILAKENPEAFARLAVGCLPKEFEGLPPPVMIMTGVVRASDEPVAVTPSLPVAPAVALPQPEAEAKLDTDRKDEPELVRAEPAKAEPIKSAPIEYPETGWR
jgi:hypothetical protein